jgi:preprotein translocase subunit SecA
MSSYWDLSVDFLHLLRCSHLCAAQAIKFLQQAVGLRGYAAKDPLTEFKLEGYNLFVEMSAQIRRNVIYNIGPCPLHHTMSMIPASPECRIIKKDDAAAAATGSEGAEGAATEGAKTKKQKAKAGR